MHPTSHANSQKTWEPMRLSYVSSVGELMRTQVTGSRRDGQGGSNCPTTPRRNGAGTVCA